MPDQSSPSRVLEYRLPITYVRISGSVDVVHDPCDQSTRTTYGLTITTETGPDLRSRQLVPLVTGGASALSFILTPDGRLAGTSLARTADARAESWKTAAKVTGGFLSVAAPALIGSGPPGWAALAGGALLVAGATVATTRLGVAGAVERDPDVLESEGVGSEADISPGDQGVPAAYVAAHPSEAATLARYRAARAKAHERHSSAVLTAATTTSPGTVSRVERLGAVLASIEVGLSAAEHAFDLWRQQQRTITTTPVEEYFRVDELPTSGDLDSWCASPEGSHAWSPSALATHTAVTLDLVDDPAAGEPTKGAGTLDLLSAPDVMYRPPRLAVLRVWRLAADTTLSHGPGARTLIEARRLFITHPGNEKEVPLNSADDQVDLAFDADGALLSIAVTSTSAEVRRAREIDALATNVSAGVAAGSDLREALAPASLVDQAAERKAAQELGLVPTAEDPLASLKAQHEQASLRARIRLADQIANSTMPPVLVQFAE